RAFGIYYALSGIAALVAGVGFGAVWKWLGQSTAFLSAAAIAGASAALLVALLPLSPGRAPGRPQRRAPPPPFATLGTGFAGAAFWARGSACPRPKTSPRWWRRSPIAFGEGFRPRGQGATSHARPPRRPRRHPRNESWRVRPIALPAAMS